MWNVFFFFFRRKEFQEIKTAFSVFYACACVVCMCVLCNGSHFVSLGMKINKVAPCASARCDAMSADGRNPAGGIGTTSQTRHPIDVATNKIKLVINKILHLRLCYILQGYTCQRRPASDSWWSSAGDRGRSSPARWWASCAPGSAGSVALVTRIRLGTGPIRPCMSLIPAFPNSIHQDKKDYKT